MNSRLCAEGLDGRLPPPPPLDSPIISDFLEISAEFRNSVAGGGDGFAAKEFHRKHSDSDFGLERERR
jgi:hypothetical protein